MLKQKMSITMKQLVTKPIMRNYHKVVQEAVFFNLKLSYPIWQSTILIIALMHFFTFVTARTVRNDL